jgi:hypothetical protein
MEFLVAQDIDLPILAGAPAHRAKIASLKIWKLAQSMAISHPKGYLI